MLLVVTILFLTIVSVVHWFLNSKVVARQEPPKQSFNIVDWTAAALILGFSMGSLSLNSFERSDEVESLYTSLVFLSGHAVALIVFLLPTLFLIRANKKEIESC